MWKNSNNKIFRGKSKEQHLSIVLKSCLIYIAMFGYFCGFSTTIRLEKQSNLVIVVLKVLGSFKKQSNLMIVTLNILGSSRKINFQRIIMDSARPRVDWAQGVNGVVA